MSRLDKKLNRRPGENSPQKVEQLFMLQKKVNEASLYKIVVSIVANINSRILLIPASRTTIT